MAAVSALSHRPRHAGSLDPRRLRELTALYAREVAAGAYPWIELDEHERWHQRVYRDRDVDIWLISWLPTQGTELHDHGGSAGAFTVISGALTETLPCGFGGRLTLRDETRAAGSSVAFGRHYVHDVRNLGPEPAVSVHAYSPPLASMGFYDVRAGELVKVASVATDDPEAPMPVPADARRVS